MAPAQFLCRSSPRARPSPASGSSSTAGVGAGDRSGGWMISGDVELAEFEAAGVSALEAGSGQASRPIRRPMARDEATGRIAVDPPTAGRLPEDRRAGD